jgi:hypothetical protein
MKSETVDYSYRDINNADEIEHPDKESIKYLLLSHNNFSFFYLIVFLKLFEALTRSLHPFTGIVFLDLSYNKLKNLEIMYKFCNLIRFYSFFFHFYFYI